MAALPQEPIDLFREADTRLAEVLAKLRCYSDECDGADDYIAFSKAIKHTKSARAIIRKHLTFIGEMK